jgi:undecaprenyl-diphosphatase
LFKRGFSVFFVTSSIFFILAIVLDKLLYVNNTVRNLVKITMIDNIYPIINWLHIFYGAKYCTFHVLILTIIMVVFRRKILALFFAITMLLQEPLIMFLKNIFKQPRPPQEYFGIIENSFSYPSGHTMVSLIIALFVSYFVFDRFHSKIKYYITFIYTFLAFLTAYGRLYLDVHWFTDIIGGWVFISGMFILIITIYKIVVKTSNIKIL